MRLVGGREAVLGKQSVLIQKCGAKAIEDFRARLSTRRRAHQQQRLIPMRSARAAA
jgi:hypothetical protein